MCHFIQLVIGDLITQVGGIRDFEATLHRLIDLMNSSEVCAVLRSRCPQGVKTRWLSRSEVLSWLLSRQESLLQINLQCIQKGRRSKFQELAMVESFHKLSLYHRVLYPCVQAIRFFEQENITLCHISPALRLLKAHLTQQEDPEKVDIAECLDYWRAIADLIRLRQRKLLDMDLVKVAFWLTSFGCASLADQRKFIPESHQLRLEYEYPRTVAVHGPLDAMIAEAALGPGPGSTTSNQERRDFDIHT
jgi:hypothetical protein